jgi:glucose-6-phosphate 1-epimerase
MDMTDVSALNDQFSLAGQLVFKQGPGGLVVAEVNNKKGTALIALQGAQVLSWAPKDEQPVIWLSKEAKFLPGKSMRGGVPICWPWFGPHASEASFPSHGYARTSPWEVLRTEHLSNDRTHLAFRLLESETHRAWWPYATPIEYHIVVGETLELELITQNDHSAPVTISEALHTYFEVGDITKVKVLGLENSDYLDKVDAGTRKQQSGPVTISSEVDRVYLNTSSECVIDDPILQRRIHINKRGSDATVVWNPWIEKANRLGDMGEAGYLRMLCVESGNIAENAVQLAPGAEHRLWVSYRVER